MFLLIQMMTSGKMSAAQVLGRGRLCAALLGSPGTTAAETAARFGVDGAGHLALHRDAVVGLFVVWVGHRHCREQTLGIWMGRMAVNLLRRAVFHHGAQIHDSRLVRDVADHGQIVGNKQVSKAQLPLKLHQHVDHLGLNGHIQGGDRLVAYDQLRFHRQRPGDTDTLALSSGELMGESVGVLLC